tara:strand:+ start:1953 stop:2792 length:840 start_codon:yes stop_codon:yes gene_type:complete
MIKLASITQLILALCCLTILSACAHEPPTPQSIPTSKRLETVRAKRTPQLAYELQESGLKLGSPVFIRTFKKEGILETWVLNSGTGTYEPFKSYKICAFSGGLGPKLREGDMQAPEGFYMVSAEQLNPKSAYHLSFDLGFPNSYDARRGRTGSLLMVHGNCKSQGCYAMGDRNIEEIYLLTEASIAAGHDVPVHIFPFKMNDENIYKNFSPLWITFWRNLQEGYDIFERTHTPPLVSDMYERGRHQYAFQDQKDVIYQLSLQLDAVQREFNEFRDTDQE